MLGVRSPQYGMFEADHLYLDHVGRHSCYGSLASMRGELFRDEEFAEFYCPNNGREGVPPSLLATALLLQAHDKVSDEEAKERADFDIRWKVALGVAVDDRPFAKSTLQLFRAHLILHERVRAVFMRSIRFARETGYLKGHRMKAAFDTSYILGRGAVKDTYNLLADGIVQVVRFLANLDGKRACGHGLEIYMGSSVKGEAAIDWDKEKGRRAFLKRSGAFGEYRWRRQVSEHCLARLLQLGIRQARYFSRLKTLFQVLIAATVTNLTLVATKLGMMDESCSRVISRLSTLCHLLA